jgi:hypothetical protein
MAWKDDGARNRNEKMHACVCACGDDGRARGDKGRKDLRIRVCGRIAGGRNATDQWAITDKVPFMRGLQVEEKTRITVRTQT